MRFSFYTFSFLFFYFPLFCQSQTNQQKLLSATFKGNVKEVIEEHCQVLYENRNGPFSVDDYVGRPKVKYEFDEKGNIRKEKTWQIENDSLISRIEYYYDENGHKYKKLSLHSRIGTTLYNIDGSPIIYFALYDNRKDTIEILRYNYNSHGDLLSWEFFDLSLRLFGGPLKRWREVEIDNNGRVAKAFVYENSTIDTFPEIYDYEYGEEGRLVKKIKTRVNPFTKRMFCDSTLYQYFTDGTIEKTYFKDWRMGGESGVSARFEKYNHNSQLIEYCSKRNVKEKWRTCQYFEFYKTGHLKKEITAYKNGEKMIEEYNQERDLVDRIYLDENGNDVTEKKHNKAHPIVPFIDYKFDKKGNWIEKVIWASPLIICQVYKREITYYEE